jgi:hypothetical protein
MAPLDGNAAQDHVAASWARLGPTSTTRPTMDCWPATPTASLGRPTESAVGRTDPPWRRVSLLQGQRPEGGHGSQRQLRGVLHRHGRPAARPPLPGHRRPARGRGNRPGSLRPRRHAVVAPARLRRARGLGAAGGHEPGRRPRPQPAPPGTGAAKTGTAAGGASGLGPDPGPGPGTANPAGPPAAGHRAALPGRPASPGDRPGAGRAQRDRERPVGPWSPGVGGQAGEPEEVVDRT